FIALEFFNAGLNSLPLRECLADRIDLATREKIQQGEAGCYIEGEQKLALSMNRGQMRPELPKHGYRRGLIVDKCATLATCGDFAGQKVEAGRELDCHIIDYCIVFQPQFGEHSMSWVKRLSEA